MSQKERVFEMHKDSERLLFTLSEYKGEELIREQTWQVLGEGLHDWHPTSESINCSTDLLT
ncbi:hypothetical protein ACFLR7_04620, partial [Acidobacteriota bacterium]